MQCDLGLVWCCYCLPNQSQIDVYLDSVVDRATESELSLVEE